MTIHSFAEYVALRGGLPLPIRSPLKGMPRVNALPTTNGHRKQLYPRPVTVPQPPKPSVRIVYHLCGTPSHQDERCGHGVASVKPPRPVKPVTQIKPTVRTVREVVPRAMVPRLQSSQPSQGGGHS